MKSQKTLSRSSPPARVAVRGKSSSASPTRRSTPKAAPDAKGTKAAVAPESWLKGKKGKAAAVVGAAAILVGVGTLVRKLRAVG